MSQPAAGNAEVEEMPGRSEQHGLVVFGESLDPPRPQEECLLVHWAEWMPVFIWGATAASREAAKRHSPDPRIGVSPRPASVRTLVGTNVGELHRILDRIAPRVPDYIPGAVPPRVAREVIPASGRWTEAGLMPLIRRLFGLDPGPEEYLPGEPSHQGQDYYKAIDTSTIEGQRKHFMAV